MNKRTQFSTYKRIVIKIGTSSLTYPNGRLNLKRIERIAWVLSDLRNQGREIILVSSGAIAVGADRLGLTERPRDIQGKQAASAVGQAVLMQIYENFFMQYNQKVAQILLTKDVVGMDALKQNAKNTFSTLLEMGVIPIVNENDTISTEELEFSDNDTLSAHVACLLEADALIILTDIDGLYDADPKTNPDAMHITYVREIDDRILSLAGKAGSKLGTGGMLAKVSAAGMAMAAGIDTVIAAGNEPANLFEILSGEEIGTWFIKARR